LDGVEDKDDDCDVDSGETDPCDPDSDSDGLADGEEDSNKNGIRDTGELDPLDDDCDNDLYKDGVEKDIGTNPLDQNSWPWIICIGTCDAQCDECAADIPSALAITWGLADINYLKMRNSNIQQGNLIISDDVLLGVESGQIILLP
jgi:hypothetical protein